MKRIKLILTMLAAAVLLPTGLLAQIKTVTSTFNGMDGPYDREVGPHWYGTLHSAEGNTWWFDCESWVEKKTVNGSFALSLSGDPITLGSRFEMIGYVKRIIIRAGGNVNEIKAGIGITKDAWEFSTIDLGTLTASTTDVKDYEIVVDESIAKDAYVYADEKYFNEGFKYGSYVGTISVEITPKSTNGATIIESVTVELSPNLPGDGMSGTCGENLTWSVSKVSPQILFISGTGKMDDFSTDSTPWAEFTGISKVVIDEGVTSVGSLAFLGLDQLSSAKLPSTLELISGMAFYRCPITSVDLPEGLLKVDYDAFCSTKLESVTIPSTVKSLGTRAFSQCPLKSIVVKEGNETFESPDNCNAIITKETKKLLQGCENTVIPDGVRSIDYMAFYWCSGLTSITIPGTVEVIETLGLGGCSGLNTLVIPDNVTTLKSSAIADCTGLEMLTIGNGMTSIGKNAFGNLTSLTDVFCTANPANLTWENYDNTSNFMANKATTIHVKKADLTAWQTKFPDINATFKGDLDGEPVDGGDVDGDGKVTAADVEKVVGIIVGLISDEKTKAAADVNSDGKIDIADIIALVNLLLGE